MEELPMVEGCALDGSGALEQRQRYRVAGAGARVVERNDARLVVALAPDIQAHLIDELIAVERECCPFLGMDWQAGERRLEVSVSRPEHAPALDAIAYALGVG
jgi:hypothetical protein